MPSEVESSRADKSHRQLAERHVKTRAMTWVLFAKICSFFRAADHIKFLVRVNGTGISRTVSLFNKTV
jgi:hypothetical protein